MTGTGLDLDGIVCSDVPAWTRWALRTLPRPLQNIAAALHHATARLQVVPAPGDRIVTGRLHRDARVTLWWLHRRGLGHVPVLFNPLRPQDAARHKADAIRALGLTSFYESDLAQAAVIARSSPHCAVYAVVATR